MKLQFGPWVPDQVALNPTPGEMTDAKNVIPAVHGYRPFASLSAYSNALNARCQGAWSIKDNAGVSHSYAGTVSKLYYLDSTTWTDASKVGGYATPADAQWRFCKYGTLGIAVNGADNPQKITLSGGTAFADLSGSPPVARYVDVVREFVVMANISSAQNRVQWSSSNNAQVWTTGTNEANQQDLPDGGVIQGIIGGEFGTIFQERQIVRMVRTVPPVTFQFDVVERGRGVLAPYSIVNLGSGIFYLGQDGFYLWNGVNSQPIGAETVDRTFLADLNFDYIARVSAAFDPVNRIMYVAYPSISSTNGVCDKTLMWAWALNPPRFSYAVYNTELVFNNFAQGVGLDSLDAISGSLDALGFSLDDLVWAGGRQQLAAFDTSHKLAFYTGDNLEAVMTTQEAQINDRGRAFVSEVTPLADTSSARIAMGSRETQNASVTYTSDVTQGATGIVPIRSDGRFHRGRLTIPAATTWNYAQGVDVVGYRKSGKR